MQKLEAVDSKRVPRSGIATAPLVPAEVNLETYPWAPVRLAFLSGHPLALAQNPEPFRALVLLMSQAWPRFTKSCTVCASAASQVHGRTSWVRSTWPRRPDRRSTYRRPGGRMQPFLSLPPSIGVITLRNE